jgi:hypothetical protein
MHLCIKKLQNMHLICSYFFNNMQKHSFTQNICILLFFFISSINNNSTKLEKLNFLIIDINFKHLWKNSKYLKIYSTNKTNTLIKNNKK